MKVLVTGAAGFIGAALCEKLLERGDEVIGIDNHNNYYEPSLKEARLARFSENKGYTHLRIDLANKEDIQQAFKQHTPERVVNLAGQAGVRYSIENPLAYIESNILGFTHILEASREHKIEHLVYASSSSVYGANTTLPFSVHQNVDHPLSLYAATKKSNELMAHTYSHLYDLPTTGLRFFTVYGPWGRPDMALFKFTKAILADEAIPVFNFGKHKRDFTYVDDIVDGVVRVLDRTAVKNMNWSGDTSDPGSSNAPWKIYNIGNNQPISLMDYIGALEEALGTKAKLEMLPMQAGDLPETFADMDDFIKEFNYQPKTSINDGVLRFVKWYLSYYK